MADWEKVATVLGQALTAIGHVVGSVKDSADHRRIKSAADALTVVGAIVEAVKDPQDMDPDKAEAELMRLVNALDENDRDADDALAAKFDNTDTVDTDPEG